MAASEFFSAFNNTLPELQAQFAEIWVKDSDQSQWTAISIDKLASGTKVMMGGQLIEVSTAIFVSEKSYFSSGVKRGDIVVVRDSDRLSVVQIESDGDQSRTLICGPSQVDVFR